MSDRLPSSSRLPTYTVSLFRSLIAASYDDSQQEYLLSLLQSERCSIQQSNPDLLECFDHIYSKLTDLLVAFTPVLIVDKVQPTQVPIPTDAAVAAVNAPLTLPAPSLPLSTNTPGVGQLDETPAPMLSAKDADPDAAAMAIDATISSAACGTAAATAAAALKVQPPSPPPPQQQHQPTPRNPDDILVPLLRASGAAEGIKGCDMTMMERDLHTFTSYISVAELQQLRLIAHVGADRGVGALCTSTQIDQQNVFARIAMTHNAYVLESRNVNQSARLHPSDALRRTAGVTYNVLGFIPSLTLFQDLITAGYHVSLGTTKEDIANVTGEEAKLSNSYYRIEWSYSH